MKLMVSPTSKKSLDELLNLDVDAINLGIQNYSLYLPYLVLYEEIESTIKSVKKSGKKVFVSLNKLIHNSEIKELTKLLLLIDKQNIDGLLYDDIGIYNLCSKLGLSIPLVLNGSHLVTNFHTINMLSDMGVKQAFLAPEITYDEMIEIRNNTTSSLIAQCYGYLPIFTSRRLLITNYLKYIGVHPGNSYEIYETKKEDSYKIYEDEIGTHVFSSFILDARKTALDLIKSGVDYIYLGSMFLSDDEYIKVVNEYLNIKEGVLDIESGFFFKKTIFKVKNND